MIFSWLKNLIERLSVHFFSNRKNSHNIRTKTERDSRNKKTVKAKNTEGIVGDNGTINHFTQFNVNGAPDTMIATIDELSEGRRPNVERTEKSFVVISPFVGIIKSPNLRGTRIHLEFSFHNRDDRPVAISGTSVKLGGGELNFKKFFKIGDDGNRSDDFTERFPIIVNARGATELKIEFENYDIDLISLGILPGELVVIVDNEHLVSGKFTFEVNEAMMETLHNASNEATSRGAPGFFDATIKS